GFLLLLWNSGFRHRRIARMSGDCSNRAANYTTCQMPLAGCFFCDRVRARKNPLQPDDICKNQ
ncbi:hypothetical protein, partial [Pseudomonas viridiflava]|uniref:hypothetical protein n=1 Tax=Pseudomonas viridiflava TaxID=33069 RepID=UPI00197D3C7A